MGKKYERLITYVSDGTGDLIWPDGPMSIVGTDNQTIFQDLALDDPHMDEETRLRIIFAAMLMPNKKTGAVEQYSALSLIECLYESDFKTSDEWEASQLLLRRIAVSKELLGPHTFASLCSKETEDLYSSKSRLMAIEVAASILKKRELHGLEHILAPTQTVIDLLHLDDNMEPTLEERNTAHIKLACAALHRPNGFRIDPTKTPVSLIRLYFQLAHAQYETEHHKEHERSDLIEIETCPICELSDYSLQSAQRGLQAVDKRDWRSLGREMAQMGMALGKLEMQLNETHLRKGLSWSASTQQATDDRIAATRPYIEWRERRIRELLKEGGKKTAIDEQVAEEFNAEFSHGCTEECNGKRSCAHRCSSETVRQQRLEIQKKLKKGG